MFANDSAVVDSSTGNQLTCGIGHTCCLFLASTYKDHQVKASALARWVNCLLQRVAAICVVCFRGLLCVCPLGGRPKSHDYQQEVHDVSGGLPEYKAHQTDEHGTSGGLPESKAHWTDEHDVSVGLPEFKSHQTDEHGTSGGLPKSVGHQTDEHCMAGADSSDGDQGGANCSDDDWGGANCSDGEG
ncbi:uncharacterized protein KZ484_025285 [Pholidichthys leucotaenia]